MRRKGRCCHLFKNKTLGFAMAELIMILFVMGLASAGIAVLFGQLSQVSRRSTQGGTIMELRAKVNSLNQNAEKWLNRMRSKHPDYASCIPDSKTATYIGGQFKCPPASNTYPDSTLRDIAASQLVYSKAPIVDLMGELIAGGDTPLYLNDSGRPCEGDNQNLRCPLMSTGYMLRSSSSTTANPGDIRFVIKIEKNMQAQNAGNIFKPVYLTVELGRSWEDGSSVKKNTVKLGYLNDGTPMVLDPKQQEECEGGEYYVGSDDTGKAICKSFPSCPEGSGAALTSVNNELECMSTSPCDEGQVHMGYYSGTGSPICTTPSPACPDKNTIQTGVSESGVATCKALPGCTESEIVKYDGISFSCVANVGVNSCPDGKLLVGFNADGSAKCEEKRGIASGDQSCAAGQYSAGIDTSGKIICKQLFASNNNDDSGLSCPEGEYLSGLTLGASGLEPECLPLPGADAGDPVEPECCNEDGYCNCPGPAPLIKRWVAKNRTGAVVIKKSRTAICNFLNSQTDKPYPGISGAECPTHLPKFASRSYCGNNPKRYFIVCKNR